MTNIQWPKELPQIMRLEGLSGKLRTAVVRTDMDAGPQKTRRRYTVSQKDFSGSVIVTEAQRKILETWYREILGNGALRFVMTDPQTLEPAEFRFTEDYSEDSADGLWTITNGQITETIDMTNKAYREAFEKPFQDQFKFIENAVKKYGGIPPYAETQNYVKKVLSNYDNMKGGS